ncbi:hypothetical protein ACFLQN_02495, partial [Candidatus Aenigmatarchaeota archaeon]
CESIGIGRLIGLRNAFENINMVAALNWHYYDEIGNEDEANRHWEIFMLTDGYLIMMNDLLYRIESGIGFTEQEILQTIDTVQQILQGILDQF